MWRKHNAELEKRVKIDSKEIIHTIKIKGNVLHGILDEDSKTFTAVGREKYGAYSTTMNIENLDFTIIKETTITY